jgi:hypothetical protein
MADKMPEPGVQLDDPIVIMAATQVVAPPAAPALLTPLADLRPNAKNVHCQFIVLVRGTSAPMRARGPRP